MLHVVLYIVRVTCGGGRCALHGAVYVGVVCGGGCDVVYGACCMWWRMWCCIWCELYVV